MRKFAADLIYTSAKEVISNGLICTNDDGVILSIEKYQTLEPDIEWVNGFICPGFINAHCHLELSHLWNKIPENTGLIGFIQEVQKNRNLTTDEEIKEAIKNADQQMFENGIVAVGDISNSDISFELKKSSTLKYHTFIEVFGFNPALAEKLFSDALELSEKIDDLSFSVTPHAPYSVSQKLMELLKKENQKKGKALTIHNQESDEENKFFISKTGDFLNLYERFNLNIDFFNASGKSSLQTFLSWITNSNSLQLVHNVYTSLADLKFANEINNKLYWCLCPNANKFISNQLPPEFLLKANDCIKTIGTDSLASNHQLSIWKEIVTIKNNFPTIELEEIIEWATINGARFLGMDAKLGSIEIEKQPGLVAISNHYLNENKLPENSSLRRLI